MNGLNHMHPPDLQALYLPVGDRYGAVKKVENLIFELEHTNIDWKYVIAEFRSYLYDFLYDSIPYAHDVLNIIFHYLIEAVARRKVSALRASDTFFDRYIFVVKQVIDGKEEFIPVKEIFNANASLFLDIMMQESEEGFYFKAINNRVKNLGSLIITAGDRDGDITGIISKFLFLQYRLYVNSSIKTNDSEIQTLISYIDDEIVQDELVHMFDIVSEATYDGNLRRIERVLSEAPADLLAQHQILMDFSHNARTWEKICLRIRRMIEEGTLIRDNSILPLLSYLIKKSHEGNDGELQLFISRTVASACTVFVTRRNHDLLKNIIDLVMPILLSEIERNGNYNSAFSTIYNIGKTIIESGNISLIDYFNDILVSSRFCFPEFSGVAPDWSVIVNASHLENIRTWMKLIELNPPVMKKLAACLIVNMKLGGVYLKDTDVFQRDISELLNSDLGEVFYLITSLAAVFPAFYHDIGATGDIRSFTEKIDTNHRMNDLIHFLRKQVHVESSSRTVTLFQNVMEYWMSGDKEILLNMIPGEVYDNLDGFFRMINMADEKAAQRIFQKLNNNFPQYDHLHFWDILEAVGKEYFNTFVTENDFEEVSDGEKTVVLDYCNRYFDSRNPTEMTSMLHYISGMAGLDESKISIWKMLYEISDDDFRKLFNVVSQCNISKVNIEKFITFLHVYRMLVDKYNFSDIRGIDKLMKYASEGLFDPPRGFFDILRGENTIEAQDELLKVQHELKESVLLSSRRFEALDTIEFKRHIAFGIPSMYGSYKEKKFDTLKVFFQMNLVRFSFFEKIVEDFFSDALAVPDYTRMKTVMQLFIRAFLVDGLVNQEMITVANLLETPNMKTSQFRDVVNYLITIHGEISDRFNETFKDVCRAAVHTIGVDNISRRFIPNGKPQNIDTVVDRLLRDQIMQSPHLQLFDNFLISIRDCIIYDLEEHGDLVCVNSDTGKRSRGNVAFAIGKTEAFPGQGKIYAPIWQVGNKAHGLLFAANMEGVNVPPGFIISSDLYKRLRDGNLKNPRFKRKILHVLKKNIDLYTGGRYANKRNPVLLSVRSGAVFSMPGVMDTITNVGITQEILDQYARHDKWFAYDCFRRLIQDLAISSFGMERSIFESLMNEAKEEAGVALKEMLTGKQMEALTLRYRYAINNFGYSIPKDPYEQLLHAIIAVYESWDSEIARNYRDYINISGEWGTAVVVQQMVFGNYSPFNITGVVHSQYLGKEKISLFGEYKTRAQGHDIVSGVAKVFPISEEQKKIYEHSSIYPSMENKFPDIYRNLFLLVKQIRDSWGNDVEIEFTMENDLIYILQIRGMTKHIFDVEELEESPADLQHSLLGQGLAASGGAVSGRAVFDMERIGMMRNKYPGEKIILIRPETNPEDVMGLKESDGILTCIGGMTSHAVLQMRRLEKSGVSDFNIMKIDEDRNIAVVDRVLMDGEKVRIREGDHITIDGNTGYVYLGHHPTRKRSGH